MIGNPNRASGNQVTPQTAGTPSPTDAGSKSAIWEHNNTIMMVVYGVAAVVVLMVAWGILQRHHKGVREYIDGANIAVNWHNALVFGGFYLIFTKALPWALAFAAKYKLPGTKTLGSLFNPTN